ncbi:MAG: hypothetical protein HY698_10110 [Deltaproteobacteria bacterium]|nr:hypothetical protein [Deltaproteobacteria bacterium]
MNPLGTHEEPLVFSALAGIFPGATSVDAFWQNILAARPAPLTSLGPRWQVARERYFAAKPGTPDRTYLDQAYCLPSETDALVADGTDRQVALGIHVLRSLTQQAGQPLSLESTALVVGTSWAGESYFRRAGTASGAKGTIPVGADVQLTAIASSVGLLGPRLAIDTACASSLYAIETAVALIRSGQARSVVVMGLCAYLPPFLYIAFSQLTALSPRAEILPFSAQASGIVPGECVAAVLLEPLSSALASGRRIYGVLRGIGLSSDGADRSVFAPGADGQRLAYARAYEGLCPGTVDYVEGHGTGTPVGDETEVTVLEEVFGSPRQGRPLPIGSVKSLIGHTLAAAGMASVIKALLMLRERTIVPHLPVEPSPHLAGTSLELPRHPTPFPEADRPLRIGISALGFGGSNAHLVLDSQDESPPRKVLFAVPRDPGSAPTLRVAGSKTALQAVAIVDVAAALGSALDSSSWACALRDRRSLIGTADPLRFAFERLPDGAYFPPQHILDAKGLRGGPNLLKRVDTFQLLLLRLTNEIMSRHPRLRASEQAGVLMINNLGGETALRFSRRYEELFRDRGHAKDTVTMTMEAIASALPSMCSGYPAYHFDLRGFHATLAGGPGAFFNSLRLAPYLLSRKCRQLLLGAGRSIKLQDEVTDAPAPGEGAGVLLLKPLDVARADGDRVLAVLRAAIPGTEADNLAAACALAGLTPDRLSVRDACQLLPTEARGRAQAVTGFLGEATGIEAILGALANSGEHAAIEVRRGTTLVLTLFLDKESPLLEDVRAPTLPLTVSFRAEEGNAVEKRPAPSVSAPASVTAMTAAPAPAHWALEARRLTAVDTTSAPPLMPRASRLALQHAWMESSSAMVHAFFDAERRLLEHLAAGSMGAPRPSTVSLDVAATLRRVENRVLLAAEADSAAGSARGSLRVDESHPYFFDHALDHVPGILLLEGGLQLVELVASSAAARPPGTEIFVDEVRMAFSKFCEKDRPVEIRLHRDGVEALASQASAFTGTIEQDGQSLASIHFRVAQAQSVAVGASRPVPKRPRPTRELLHKHGDEQVLVLPLEPCGNGTFACEPLPPPTGHIFEDGSPSFLSPLYLLEIARQATMLVAHTVENIPLGLPMNLVDVRLALEKPISRSEPLRLEIAPLKQVHLGTTHIARVQVLLCGMTGVLGRVEITAQVVDAETYQKQRSGSPPASRKAQDVSR